LEKTSIVDGQDFFEKNVIFEFFCFFIWIFKDVRFNEKLFKSSNDLLR